MNTGLPNMGRNCLGTLLFILLPFPPASNTTPTFFSSLLPLLLLMDSTIEDFDKVNELIKPISWKNSNNCTNSMSPLAKARVITRRILLCLLPGRERYACLCNLASEWVTERPLLEARRTVAGKTVEMSSKHEFIVIYTPWVSGRWVGNSTV